MLAGEGYLLWKSMSARANALPIRRILADAQVRESSIRGRAGELDGRVGTEASRLARAIAAAPWAMEPVYDLAMYYALLGERGEEVGERGLSAYDADALRNARGALALAGTRNWVDRFPAVAACLLGSVEEPARARFEEFEAKLPTFGELGAVYWISAELAGKAKLPEKAADYAVEALSRQPNLFMQMVSSLRDGALGDVASFVNRLPDDGELLADVAGRLRDFAPRELAESFDERALRVVAGELGEARPERGLALRAARLAERLGRADEAAQYYAQHLEAYRNEVDVRLERAREHIVKVRLERAWVLFGRKRYAEAAEEVRNVLYLEPRNADALMLQSRLKAYVN